MIKTRIMACVIAITIAASSICVYASELPTCLSTGFETTELKPMSSLEEEFYSCDIECSSSFLIINDGRKLNGLQASNDRKSFALFDFSGYETQLDYAEKITISAQAAYSSNLIRDIRFSVLDDSLEEKINSSLTYTQAVNDGIWDGGIAVGERLENIELNSLNLDLVKDEIINALISGHNKLLAIRIERPSEAGDNIILNDNLKLSITYSSECVNSLAEQMQWSDISEQNINSVTDNIVLPTQYRNCDISWQSSNEAVVGLDGTVVRQAEDTEVTLTATFSLGSKTASTDFVLIVPKFDISAEKEIYTCDIACSSAFLLINDGRNLGGLQASNDRKSFVLFDFSSYETQLAVAEKVALSIQAAYSAENLIRDIRFSVIPDGLEEKINSSLTYTDAVNDGIWDGGIAVGERADTTELNSLNLDLDKDKLINALGSGDNSLLALRLERVLAAGDNSVFEPTALKLTITYSSDCVTELAAGMQWSDISDQGIDAVTNNLTLPSQYKICGMTWESDDNSIIAADGTVNRKMTDSTVTLTATVSLGKKNAERSFCVTVPKLEPSFVLSAINSTESWLRVKEIITAKHYDFFESTLKTSDYSKIKDTDPVFKELTQNLPYVSFDDLVVALADSVTRIYNIENTIVNSSRPSVGVKGTSGGSAVITTPIEVDKKTNDVPEISFIDITADHWAYSAVNELVLLGTISGYEDNSFRPQTCITRAEFAKMTSSFSVDIEINDTDISFADVSSSDWYFESVSDAASKNLINGDGVAFRPNEYISREDAVLIIYRLLSAKGKAPRGTKVFADRKSISEYAKQAVGAMGAAGIVEGSGDNMFLPQNQITRAEAAQLLYNALVK